MKARLNVSGRKMVVASISYYNDEIASVMIVDDNGDFKTYYDLKGKCPEGSLVINIKEALEFPDVEARIDATNNELIEHLVEMYEEESEKLVDIAVEAMENEPNLPFDKSLSDKQKEYKLMQQRVLGIIDTIEEVRAFQDGLFDRKQIIETVTKKVEGMINNGYSL